MNELQIFENNRCLYHQTQFLVQLLKSAHRQQKLSLHNHILNRVKQILEMKDQNYKLGQEILSLSVIQCLEEILTIEQKDIKQLYNNLKILVEYLAALNDYLGESVQQILLGEVSIDIQNMNQLIETCHQKTSIIITKHQGFFTKYNQIQNVIQEINANIKTSIDDIQSIMETLDKRQIMEHIEDKAQGFNKQLQQNLYNNLFD
ncbi:hypothetical protein pb186bvf_013940 [Paramecium bursaria]